MKQLALALVMIAGCASGPSGYNASVWDDGSFVHLDLLGPWDHDFTGATATVNGIAMGAPSISPGTSDSIGNPGRHSILQFALDASELGPTPALAIEVHEGGTTHTFELPTFQIPRTVDVTSPLDQPLTGNEAIAMTTNVASDVIDASSSLLLEIGDQVCSFGHPLTIRDGVAAIPLTPGFTDWYCGTPPVAGTIVDATLVLTINIGAEVTCDVGDCTATPLDGGGVHVTKPVRLQL
jgi:hypothetical protein